MAAMRAMARANKDLPVLSSLGDQLLARKQLLQATSIIGEHWVMPSEFMHLQSFMSCVLSSPDIASCPSQLSALRTECYPRWQQHLVLRTSCRALCKPAGMCIAGTASGTAHACAGTSTRLVCRSACVTVPRPSRRHVLHLRAAAAVDQVELGISTSWSAPLLAMQQKPESWRSLNQLYPYMTAEDVRHKVC